MLNNHQQEVKACRIKAQCRRSPNTSWMITASTRACYLRLGGRVSPKEVRKIDCGAIRFPEEESQLDRETWQTACDLTLHGLSVKAENDEKEISNWGLSNHTSITRIVWKSTPRLWRQYNPLFRGKIEDRHVYLINCSIFPVGSSPAIQRWTARVHGLLSSCSHAVFV